MENHLRVNGSTHEQDDEDKQHHEEEEDIDDDEEETTKLEEEVKEMAKKVEDYRSTLPHHLKSSLSSFLHSQRPSLSLLDEVSEPGPSSGPYSGSGSKKDNSSTELEADDGGKIPDEVQLLRDKISSNISAIPK
ncbi:Pseudokinase FAM20A, partial [Bienertia sinuspersici]